MATPTQTQLSAMLKVGQRQAYPGTPTSMKSVTFWNLIRSIRLPKAPERIRVIPDFCQ